MLCSMVDKNKRMIQCKGIALWHLSLFSQYRTTTLQGVEMLNSKCAEWDTRLPQQYDLWGIYLGKQEPELISNSLKICDLPDDSCGTVFHHVPYFFRILRTHTADCCNSQQLQNKFVHLRSS